MQADFSLITGNNFYELEGKLNTYLVTLANDGSTINYGDLNAGIQLIGARYKLTLKQMLHLAMSAASTATVCRTNSHLKSSLN